MNTTPDNLVESRVRIVLRRHFREMPIDIMRGTVTQVSTPGLTISGRHFQEVRDSVSGLYEEHPLVRYNKVYFIPYSSMKYIDVIMPDSPEAERADRIEGSDVLESPIKEYVFASLKGKKAV